MSDAENGRRDETVSLRESAPKPAGCGVNDQTARSQMVPAPEESESRQSQDAPWGPNAASWAGARAFAHVDWTLVGTLGVLLIGYILFHDLLGATLLYYDGHDSYSVQAAAWLSGRMDVSGAYTWLELAEYKGLYYISFPPLPSVVMLPLVMLFRSFPPSNFMSMLTALLSVVFCYQCFLKNGVRNKWAMFWALFYVMGSNMLWMSTAGGVWFLAQGFNLMFATAAVWAYLSRKRALCLILLALAIGCRPFTLILFALVFIAYVAEALRKPDRLREIAKTFLLLIVPALIAGAYMWYNYARFDDPLEFGHNYLVEFVEAEDGQFNISYLGEHIQALFFTFPTFSPTLDLDFPLFDGFAFYIANPLFLVFLVLWIRDIITGNMSRRKILWVTGLWLNLFVLMLHKSFGGWQFGARYTVDLLPYVLLYLLADKTGRPNGGEKFVCAVAILFNMYGAMHMNLG